MKPINREKELHKDSNDSNNSIIHKASKKDAKAKQQVFGKSTKPKVYGNKKNKQKKNQKKKAATGLPLGAKVGAGVAAVAVVGGSAAAIVHNVNKSKVNVQDANRHSDQSGLDFGNDDDGKNKTLSKEKKDKDNKENKKDNKKDKKKKGEDTLSALLGDGDFDGADLSDMSDSKDKSSKSDKKKDDLDSLIDGMSGGNSKSDKALEELAAKADKSISSANKLGKDEKNNKDNKNNTPSELPNAKKDNAKDTPTDLVNKSGNTEKPSNLSNQTANNPTNKPNDGGTGNATSRPNTGNTETPTTAPTSKPTSTPTTSPTTAPTSKPTSTPTTSPTIAPTSEPTSTPTTSPTIAPTSEPTSTPTSTPTSEPTSTPTSEPTTEPTTAPTTYPFQSVPDGTSKVIQFVNADGTVVGSGTLSKSGNTVSVNGIPNGYKLSDLDGNSHSAQLLQWPNSVRVISDGTGQPSTPTYPYENVSVGASKSVNLVDDNGNVVGTGTLTRTADGVNISNIPANYQLKDRNDLLQWPDSITVVSNGTTDPSTPSTPTYPYENVSVGASKSVNLVDESGNVVGTGTLTRTAEGVSISDIPSRYQLRDRNDMLQWPDSIVVVSNGTSEPDMPTDPNTPSTPTYPFQGIPDGTNKDVQFVLADGTVVGRGTLTKQNNSVHLSGIPSNYQLADLDNKGHSAQLLQWPDRIIVASNV